MKGGAREGTWERQCALPILEQRARHYIDPVVASKSAVNGLCFPFLRHHALKASSAGGAELWRACMGPNVMRLLSRWRQRVFLNGMNISYIFPLMIMSLSAGFDGISHL